MQEYFLCIIFFALKKSNLKMSRITDKLAINWAKFHASWLFTSSAQICFQNTAVRLFNLSSFLLNMQQ